MIIMGLDPGTARVGWGVLQEKNAHCLPHAYGLIETTKNLLPQDRLMHIHTSLTKLLKRYHPNVVAIEELFFATNAKTAIAVGQARGVLLLTCALFHIPTYSYSPLAIKRCITGDGKADKKQVQYMITKQLRLQKTPKPDDVADALAIALTYAFSYRMQNKYL